MMKERSVLLWDDISSKSAQEFVTLTSAYSGVSLEPIFVYIHSDGGCLDAAAAIIDQIQILQKHGITVVTIAQGKCSSSGCIILAFGNKGHRFATKNSVLMLHPSSVEDYGSMDTKVLRNMLTFSLASYNSLLEQVIELSGYSSARLKKMIDRTLWMSPQNAIEYGIIDGIWNGQVEAYDGQNLVYDKQPN